MVEEVVMSSLNALQLFGTSAICSITWYDRSLSVYSVTLLEYHYAFCTMPDSFNGILHNVYTSKLI